MATLFTPIQVAVALGVVLHILLHIFRSAEAVRLERVIPQEDGFFAEGKMPEALPRREPRSLGRDRAWRGRMHT